MANLSPDCRDGNHSKCQGAAWDLKKDEGTTCECLCHRPVAPEESWADQEYRANLRAGLEAARIAAENAQAERDSHHGHHD